ncbi:U-box domain-containing protein [Actinidia chinensis var. chinensis]|uniref:U-box domain-containing protein 12 n=1 Tax=Actinidia chinensis var. chinensis TaxID=1590841 RepID=A0A2R6PWZ2_ACTCC|nr:U-box domain-containing protein [Actinidia chinensis var. chinensis]
MAVEEDCAVLLKKLIGIVDEIAEISDFKCVVRRQCRDLSRRLKLLTPLFEEFLEIREKITEETVKALVLLEETLESAKEFLRVCSRGSKILLVLQSEKLRDKFQELTVRFEQALTFVSYEKLDIPDELKEQVELVHSQFGKAKERTEAPYLQLYEDLLCIYNLSSDVDTEVDVSKLSEKLELTSIGRFKEESLALDEMIASGGWDVELTREKISLLMKKFEDYVRAGNPNISIPFCGNCSLSDQACTDSPKSPVVPDDFRCPISLDLMNDPVIICSGQTYERACIKRWLEAGHGTCPKTQQKLSSATLTPNYALSSVIGHWCETNGVEPQKRSGISRPGKTSSCSVEGVDIDALLVRLTSGDIEDQRAAAGELRLLAKNNSNNRLFIAEAGAIPLLVAFLSTPDTITQEHVITALLNLSICEDNKRTIVSSDAVPGILHVLKNGSMQARENAAATIFSLTIVDEYKMTVGALGAIPAVVALLREGGQRGKKDAAAALFNLCIYQGNKVRAIRAGLVPLLMGLLTDSGGEMVDEALAIVAMLASHSEGKSAIRSFEAVPLFVELIRNGSPKSRENATAVLVHLCPGDQQYVEEAINLGVVNPLLDLAENGTDRGKRKAAQLLQLLGNPREPLEEAHVQTNGQTEAQILPLQLPVIASANEI